MSLLNIYDDVWSIILLYLDFDDWSNIESFKKFRYTPTIVKLHLLKQMSFIKCTEKEAKNIIKLNPLKIKYIHNPSEEVCRLSVQQNNHAIKYINMTGFHNFTNIQKSI